MQVRERRIPASDRFDFAAFMADPASVREWNIQGLPADSSSTENGVMVSRGKRWPLMIDPQGQANKWVKAMEGGKGLKVLSLTTPDLARQMESAIQFGQPVLLQDVLEGERAGGQLLARIALPPAPPHERCPLLQRWTPYWSRCCPSRSSSAATRCALGLHSCTGGPASALLIGKRSSLQPLHLNPRAPPQVLIKLGDKEVDYSPEFKLYITTKLANPHYTPEVSTKVRPRRRRQQQQQPGGKPRLHR